MHHFLPGIGLALATGAAAILTHADGRGFLLGLPFGTGAGLILDEIALLVGRDNAYWDSERLALIQSAAAAVAAAVLAADLHRRGAALLAGADADEAQDGASAARGAERSAAG